MFAESSSGAPSETAQEKFDQAIEEAQKEFDKKLYGEEDLDEENGSVQQDLANKLFDKDERCEIWQVQKVGFIRPMIGSIC